MREAAIAENLRGKFDRGTRGRSVATVTLPIERGRVRSFAQALGETAPIHLDVEAARNAGHPDLVAPPSFFMAIEAYANDELRRRGEMTAAELVRFDFRYLLHGDERYAYSGLVYAGDEVSFSTRIVDFYDKKGGAMEFVVLESTVSHTERGELIRSTRTLLHRLPAEG